MEKVIKTLYTSLYQRTTGVSYREKVIMTSATIGIMLVIMIPLLGVLIYW